MMNYLLPLKELTLARFREQLRQPEVLFWVFAFPLLLAVALGLAFRNRPPDVIHVAVESGPRAEALVADLKAAGGFAASVLSPEVASEELRTGQVALVVVPGDSLVYRYDPTRSESRLARIATDDALQQALGRRNPRATADHIVTERGARYIDFLIPGLLGLNLMSTGMWGLGYAVVDARRRKLMKRLLASPMRRSQYLLSFIAARLVILAPEVIVLLGFAALAFGVPVRGSILSLAVVVVLGAMCFAGLGLLTASRAQTVEAVSGLMNLVMLPMWVLSGVFFSSAKFPAAMQPFIRVLPLTALNDALRGIMLQGASLASLAAPIGICVVWGSVSFAVALRTFRWI
ncbi:MAG: ABC transporter permease [Gemmatimonadetes bacterium]|jgi:ABC-2 type transport system permease protein|nr:ABC transporter permease [Gemmatimonadota bacterium]